MSENKPHSDVQKIGDLLRLAREQQVAEVEAEIPFCQTATSMGLMTVRAKWRKRPATPEVQDVDLATLVRSHGLPSEGEG